MPDFVVAPPTTLNVTAKKLIDENGYEPQGAVTKCSEFLRDFAAAVFGYHGFEGKDANATVRFLRTGAEGWTAVYDHNHDPEVADGNFKSAQDLANQGRFVVVGLLNPGQEHGHVAVVVTGQRRDSTTWADANLPKSMPIIAQAGTDVFAADRLSRGISPDSYAHGEFVIYQRAG